MHNMPLRSLLKPSSEKASTRKKSSSKSSKKKVVYDYSSESDCSCSDCCSIVSSCSCSDCDESVSKKRKLLKGKTASYKKFNSSDCADCKPSKPRKKSSTTKKVTGRKRTDCA